MLLYYTSAACHIVSPSYVLPFCILVHQKASCLAKGAFCQNYLSFCKIGGFTPELSGYFLEKQIAFLDAMAASQ